MTLDETKQKQSMSNLRTILSFTLSINAFGFVMVFFGVVADSLSPLLLITDGLLKRGRPRFFPGLLPLVVGASEVDARC